MWVSDRRAPGKVVKEHSSRSYEVSTDDGNFRRNRRDLVSAPSMSPEEPLPDIPSSNQPEADTEQPNSLPTPPRRVVTRSRTGNAAQPPEHLDPSWKRSD